MANKTTTDDVFPLLELPPGVETILLPFVVSGRGGLQSLLNLRQVCSTTKSWIESLPPRQGKSLFSKAQVRMDSQVDTLQRFLETPPPSAVSALSLNIRAILDKNPPAEEKELWDRFSAVWAPRLETLQLRNEDNEDAHNADVFNGNARILNLVESPHLQILRLADIFVPWDTSTPIPSSFYKVTELSINFAGGSPFPLEDNGQMKRLYSELTKNSNLRKLQTTIHGVAKNECFQNFIDAKKDDARLEVNLHLKAAFSANESDEDDVEGEDDVKYLQFAESVLASKSTIRLQMSSFENLDHALALLPRHIALEMFKKVESVRYRTPSEDTWSLLENLPRLKQVKVQISGSDEVRSERLTFPPSLQDLSFPDQFPLRPALPEALRSLTLQSFACNVTELANCLSLLKTQCAGLETLNITWTCSETSEPPAENIEKSPGFPNLRSLTFKCRMKENDVEACRAVLLRGFQVETIPLHHLALRFLLKWKEYINLPVLTVPFLKRLCEGPIRNSLLMVDIQKDSATPDGLALLESLASLAAANAKNREEREGRGQWQRQWELID